MASPPDAATRTSRLSYSSTCLSAWRMPASSSTMRTRWLMSAGLRTGWRRRAARGRRARRRGPSTGRCSRVGIAEGARHQSANRGGGHGKIANLERAHRPLADARPRDTQRAGGLHRLVRLEHRRQRAHQLARETGGAKPRADPHLIVEQLDLQRVQLLPERGRESAPHQRGHLGRRQDDRVGVPAVERVDLRLRAGQRAAAGPPAGRGRAGRRRGRLDAAQQRAGPRGPRGRGTASRSPAPR